MPDYTATADCEVRRIQPYQATKNYFKAPEFKKFIEVSHSIAEDGDVERNVLLAQKKDGTWQSLTYTDYPF